MMQQLPLALEARAAGHAGAARAASHADRVAAQWTRTAVQAVITYAAARREAFLAEDVREYADQMGVDEPPDARAWGQVFRIAKREGIIVAAGYAPSRSSNGSPKVLWVAA